MANNIVVPSLQYLCQDAILAIVEKNKYHPRLINDLCKRVPHPLLDALFTSLLARNAITDVALLAFLVPDRTQLNMSKAVQIRNSTFKQISLNCPHLRSLDLSDCVQVCNSVVASILQGCPLLSELTLDRCHRVTDAAFDATESPFSPLVACLSLEEISMQGCPQLTGSVVTALNKTCVRLKVLNLSQCKKIESTAIQAIFEHRQILSLNLSYIDGVSDEVFANYPLSELVVTDRDRGNVTDELNTDTRAPVTMDERSVHVSSANTHASPLQKLFLSKSTITDASMFRLSFLSQLLEIRLQWCSSVTDQGIMALTINCPKLQEIDLKSCQITDASLEAIANNCANLRSLDLSWCVHISDSGIVQFSERTRQQYLKSYPSRVQEEVSDIFISEKEASLIDSEEVSAALVALDSLKMQSRVADGSARAAPSSSTCVGLKNLNLVWCEQLTDLSVAALMAIPTLQHVDVSGCAGLSYSLLLELQAVGVVVKSNSS